MELFRTINNLLNVRYDRLFGVHNYMPVIVVTFYVKQILYIEIF